MFMRICFYICVVVRYIVWQEQVDDGTALGCHHTRKTCYHCPLYLFSEPRTRGCSDMCAICSLDYTSSYYMPCVVCCGVVLCRVGCGVVLSGCGVWCVELCGVWCGVMCGVVWSVGWAVV